MNRLVAGAVAGAAGKMALDVTTYGDMVLRGRGSSSVPEETVRRMLGKFGIEPLDKPSEELDEQNKNRQSALGPLAGYAVCCVVGAMFGAVSTLFKDVPALPKGVIIGALAMAASDVPAILVHATDPKEWGAAGWLSDIIPHVAYGLVTAAVCDEIAARA